MKTAPKDGTHILLAYPSFSDDGEVYVGMGRWVDCPHNAQVTSACQVAYTTQSSVVVPTSHPHWEVAYVAILQHGGAYRGYSYEARSGTINHPLGWLPLPEPTKTMKRAAQTGSHL